MKETLRQLTPEQLTGVVGGNDPYLGTRKCPEDDAGVRTRRCACKDVE